MVNVKVGDTLRDNDPRNHGREVKVTGIFSNPHTFQVFVEWYKTDANGQKIGRVNSIRLDRIHAPGYAGKTGWTVVAQAQFV